MTQRRIMENFKFHCQYCKQPMEADSSWVGQQVQCPNCGSIIPVQPDFNYQMTVAKTALNREENRIKEYKVLTQKDKWFSGKFDPENLEQAINAYANQGWRVIAAVTASFPGFISNNREEMIIILERDK